MASRAQPSGVTTRRRKRIQPPVFSGVKSSYTDKDSDFICPVCFELIDEAYMTRCGHTFCFRCIKQTVVSTGRCPNCNTGLTQDDAYPNFLLNDLILKHKNKLSTKSLKASDQVFSDIIHNEDLDISRVNALLDVLTKKRSLLINDSHNIQYQLLSEFLMEVRQRKQLIVEEIQNDIRILDQDLIKAQELYREVCASSSEPSQETLIEEFSILGECDTSSSTSHTTIHPLQAQSSNGSQLHSVQLQAHSSSALVPSTPILSHSLGTDHAVPSNVTPNTPKRPESFNSSCMANPIWSQTTMAARRKCVSQHFEDLQDFYFSTRRAHLFQGEKAGGLCEFIDCLTKFTRYTSFRPLASLNYANDIYSGSSIVSSIEFDRDCEYFAIAGVTMKIKVFEYDAIIRDAVDIHYPINEMVCNSKISSLSWSKYHKTLMASSDYEGTVTLWDAFTGVRSTVFQEHEKRCWSVDFNAMDPKLLASGSDDAKVKIWSTNNEHSLISLEAKANVCCVKFSPTNRDYLAFGCADHCIHYYDLRQPKQSVIVLRGHKKAVSYVKFLNSQELVSASTDSQLKSWNVSQSCAVRTYTGHVNDKNFVGLDSNGDYILCGSETNSLYVFYKGLSKHLLCYKFDTVRSVLEKDKKEDDGNEFVSAVSWRPDSNVLAAANSQGIVKLLELV